MSRMIGKVPAIRIRLLRGSSEARSCADLMANSEPWVTLRRSYDDSMAMLTDPEREVYVALVEGEVIGFTILQMKGAFVGYVQTVGVMPEWRNRGVGTKLIGFAERRIFRQCPNAFICVSSFNQQARWLYERLGYEVVGELKDYVVAGHSEILMRKSVSPLSEFQPSRPRF